MDLLSLVLSVLSLAASAFLTVWLFHLSQEDARVARTIEEIERTYDPEFAASLTRVLDRAYGFLEDPGNATLSPGERFDRFWGSAGTEVDTDMFVLTTRLDSIENCFTGGDCSRDEMLERFPDLVYQAMFFLRDFIFLDDETSRKAQASGVDGWWMDSDIYRFLADYCIWARDAHGGMDLWSVQYERLRAPGSAEIDPCLPAQHPR